MLQILVGIHELMLPYVQNSLACSERIIIIVVVLKLGLRIIFDMTSVFECFSCK